MRTLLILAPIALAAPGVAKPIPDTVPVVDAREITRSYADTSDNFRQDYMRRLNQLCRSRDLDDRALCDRAWAAINAAYADLQVKKTRAR